MADTVRVDLDGGVATLTLDQPERRNALTLEMVDELVEAFDRFEGGRDVAAVIVTGAPPAFCAGADLGHLGGSGQPDRGAGMRSIYEGFLRVARSPLVTIAAVNGAAVGAGMNMALACDIRVSSPRARFDTRFVQLGLHPGGGHTWMLHRIGGPQVAAAMVLCGEVLDGEAAERCGLVWRCVPEEHLLAEAGRLAERAAAAPRELLRRTKDTLRRVAGMATHDEAVDHELGVQLWSTQQSEFAERLSAMSRKIRGG
jgi:enoyl-CoA hydratase